MLVDKFQKRVYQNKGFWSSLFRNKTDMMKNTNAVQDNQRKYHKAGSQLIMLLILVSS